MRSTLTATMLLALAPLATAEVLTSVYRLQGGKVGTNRFEEFSGGKFVSVTEITVGSAKVASELEGERKDGRLSEFRLKFSQGSVSLEASYADGKLSATQNGKQVVKDLELDLSATAAFSAFHPQIATRLLADVGMKPLAKKLPVFLIENLAVLSTDVVGAVPRKVTVDGAAVSVQALKLRVQGIEIETVGDGDRVLGVAVPAQSLVAELEGSSLVFDDPMARHPELSRTLYKTRTLSGVKAKLRDGTTLVADVTLPDRPGKWPLILVRTCYGRGISMLQAEFFASRGYAFMAQDVRGRGDSEGDFDPLVTEAADGYDTLEWITAQEWSNGRVGMIGASYLGFVQWCAAVTRHPALKCIVPQVSPPDPTRNFPWDHGMFMLAGSLWWARIGGDRSGDVANALDKLTGMKKMATLPLLKADDEFLGKNIPWFDRWLARDSLDKWDGSFRLDQVAKVKIPVLHISGTWDGDGIGTKLHWEALRATGKKNQWLVYGPWNHAFNTSSSMGDVSYGPDAILELDSLYLRFFDAHLKQREGFMAIVPKVRFFLSGANKWLDVPDWPPPGSWTKTWYLSGGSGRGLDGGGELNPVKSGAAPSTIVYDPARIKIEQDTMEVNLNASLRLTKEALSQDGTILFRTQPFAKPTRIGGPVTCEMFVSTSGRDAGFLVSIAEQRADGSVRALCLPGKARIGWKEEGTWGPVKPNDVIRLTIEPWEFAHQFPKGSRLVAIVTCDGFPGFARIPGTGESETTATKLVKTTQKVYRSGAHASRLKVTMLPD
ncbi:MAG: CocE/NonD family hydrolase [Fimbriimonadaceae bacterium]